MVFLGNYFSFFKKNEEPLFLRIIIENYAESGKILSVKLIFLEKIQREPFLFRLEAEHLAEDFFFSFELILIEASQRIK